MTTPPVIICNTHEQLKAAEAAGHARAYAIRIYSAAIRYPKRQSAWTIYHLLHKLDTRFWLHSYQGTFHQRKSVALEAAKDYMAEKNLYTGLWKRNRHGDWVPADIQNRWPIRKPV